ncbi:MAG: response regulator [Candidatus Omnitrophica bacterium]|nr:response regulator [Candidatus Omnitrophota bacterium]
MNISILVADDEKDLIDSFGMLLQDLGYDVSMATDGDTTLKLLREKNPDVLILDINMPKVSGEEVLRQLSGMGLKTKVIISTGHTVDDKNLKDRILKAFSVSAFLEKPSSIEEIDYVIKEVVKGG